MAHPVRSTGRQCNLNLRTPFLHPLTASAMQKNLFTVSVSARELGEQIAEALVGAVFNRFFARVFAWQDFKLSGFGSRKTALRPWISSGG